MYLPKNIKADLERRFNRVNGFTPIKLRANTKVHVAYMNWINDEDRGTVEYYVGVCTVKGETVRIANINRGESILAF